MVNCIEVLELRTGANNSDYLEEVLQNTVKSIQESLKKEKIKIYRSFSVHGDYSIHLVHKTSKPDRMGSQLGIHLALSLKQFGLINHQVWKEFKTNHQEL